MIDKFIALCKEINIDVTPQILAKLDIYYNFLKEYNDITNITAITDKEDVYFKHFYDSLTLCKGINLENIHNMIDIGSGAGFPGMVIKIFYPHIDVVLLDSNNKKTNFLQSLSQKLDLQVTIINDRAENYAINNLNKFDLVTSRAVAYVDIIASLSLPLASLNGKVVLMKGDFENEKLWLKKYQEKLNIKSYELINVNYLDNLRTLVVLEKDKQTNKVLNYNQILKNHNFWQKQMQ